MTILYCAYIAVDYEPGKLLGIFTTLEKAQARLDNHTDYCDDKGAFPIVVDDDTQEFTI